MDTTKELSKIATILQEGRFEHKGTDYTLELEATELNPLNSNLHGKPPKKLTGVDSRGNVLIVWSHDVSVCTTPLQKVEAPEYEQTSTEPDWQGEVGSIEADEEPDPEPVVTPKRGRKKKQS